MKANQDIAKATKGMAGIFTVLPRSENVSGERLIQARAFSRASPCPLFAVQHR
jgi:hypothetical protein